MNDFIQTSKNCLLKSFVLSNYNTVVHKMQHLYDFSYFINFDWT